MHVNDEVNGSDESDVMIQPDKQRINSNAWNLKRTSVARSFKTGFRLHVSA